jgi:hypothetical protein
MVFLVWHLKQFNTLVIYFYSMEITKAIWLYNTELWYYHAMAVIYRSKMFYNMDPWWVIEPYSKLLKSI